MEGSTLFNFSAICSIFIFSDKKMSISSMYLKYEVLMRNLYLKGLDSKNSKNKQAKIPLSRFPIGRPNFSL